MTKGERNSLTVLAILVASMPLCLFVKDGLIVFAVVSFAVGAVVAFAMVEETLRTGKFECSYSTGIRSSSRYTDPIGFWLLVALFAFCGIGQVGVCVMLIGTLMQG